VGRAPGGGDGGAGDLGRESVREAILENHAAVLGLPAVAARGGGVGPRDAGAPLALLDRPAPLLGPAPDDLDALVPERVGTEHLVAARDAGRGAILLTAHVGNFEIGGFFLQALGLEGRGSSTCPTRRPSSSGIGPRRATVSASGRSRSPPSSRP
jgi:Lauroyl/myristoyl acyltransferase